MTITFPKFGSAQQTDVLKASVAPEANSDV